MTTIAAAPSLSWEAFPAVTWPPSRNTGGSFASFSREVSVRIPSSTSTRAAPGTSTGRICSLNRPSCVAAASRRWLSSAKRSISSRVTRNFSATTSPVMPEARGDHVAHEDLLDVGRDQARPVHRFRDDEAPKLNGLHVAERTAVLAHRSAAGTRENHFRQATNLRAFCKEDSGALSYCPV